MTPRLDSAKGLRFGTEGTRLHLIGPEVWIRTKSLWVGGVVTDGVYLPVR